ncbi:unnamed protein product [Haemonchus placei]|uniref:MIF4G domain-containing protein n=1 Tax=Haemonchus placei TaxID=6290 RepID=A0A0N4VZ98_HAEPC|nr:unnamed protein product [Haemonchus placei]
MVPQTSLMVISKRAGDCAHPLLPFTLQVANFHDAISSYYSFHLLRKSIAVQGNEKRVQAVLLRELDALKSAMEMTVMGNSLVRLFERMIFDEESAVQTVHRLFIVVCRSFDDQSFEQVLKPLVELLSSEASLPCTVFFVID